MPKKINELNERGRMKLEWKNKSKKNCSSKKDGEWRGD